MKPQRVRFLIHYHLDLFTVFFDCAFCFTILHHVNVPLSLPLYFYYEVSTTEQRTQCKGNVFCVCLITRNSKLKFARCAVFVFAGIVYKMSSRLIYSEDNWAIIFLWCTSRFFVSWICSTFWHEYSTLSDKSSWGNIGDHDEIAHRKLMNVTQPTIYSSLLFYHRDDASTIETPQRSQCPHNT